MEKFKGWIPDFERRQFFYGELHVEGEYISKVAGIESEKGEYTGEGIHIMPGLVDAHVHIESSMLIPSEFARQAVRHGTVAVISDPHEIANVLGKEGVEFMIRDAQKVPLKIRFTAPSCVPATHLEESGAILGDGELKEMAREYNYAALGEMMNFPGVVSGDDEVMKKIRAFREMGIPVDGHAPGLTGGNLRKYIDAGISTDHEATSLEEAREKIRLGMKILIREGSAAKNFEKLWPLVQEYPTEVMLCCDDIHPDELLDHHIDKLMARGQEKGLDIFDLMQAASVNPAKHYKLDTGLLKTGDKADFILVGDLSEFKVLETYINGRCVFKKGEPCFETSPSAEPNRFNCNPPQRQSYEMRGESGHYRVIGAVGEDLYTLSETHFLKAVDNVVMPDNEADIIRIAVVNRYKNTPPALGWIRNTGIKEGALASSVAHDSHNIIVVGTSSRFMEEAVNMVIKAGGGISFSGAKGSGILPLPVAGLMSSANAEVVAAKYKELNSKAGEMGSGLKAPFMTLSFMALLVIPELKIGDRGLFDVKQFKFVEPKVD